MTGLAQPRIRIPRTARPGEVIEIRTLIEHPMENGIRGGVAGVVPHDMLTRLQVRRDGETVFTADLGNGTSANPYHVFHLRMERTAELEFLWTDERGRTARATARVVVA
ncbi:thiosulfate oxidation carrier complex protein SoxZ [Siccirubricoccus deserti]|uniref:Thiosulfate oxidation carrier complex protein SoxZ n=1 Tax=Siccirubricoccus deserti TaxID=2013562 RepID=A0A9X0UCS1_9PROT|nr:thiosulfate oxidation carrier complex protein SoxZ [Siccirubricoccus deserti]MBC4014801.1 thiosulfate oxidation carrier complex protein SoxZ [Siccirubricoccus deserti]GGC35137.1 thiosulfate oxidation carrier complex protein SoxZ [Siccirubricoccus deserti]